MELLILFVIGLLIAIFVLPFVAIAKANAAKRSLDDLLRRLSTVENDLRNLGRQTAAKREAPATAPAPRVEAAPPPLPVTAPAPVAPEEKPEPPPIPQRIVEASVSQIATPPKPPINWEQFMGAKLFAWIGE